MRWLISLGLIGCTAENNLTELKDPNDNSGVEIEVEPSVLQFSSLTAGEQEVQSFTIRSVGVDPLEVNLIEVIGEQAASFTILTTDPTFTLEPNEEQVIDVAFSPLDANQIYAEALIDSNAGNEEQALVALQAEGIIGALDISPNPLSLGEHYVGCSVENEVTITNVGSMDVTISDISQLGDGFSVAFEEALPLTLAPSELLTVDLTFMPLQEVEVTGQLSVTSDEPMGTRIAEQTGSGLLNNQVTQEWEFAIDPPADIMFSVDASCSMSDNINQLSSNFSSFISQLSNYSNNWQVMVTGGDTGCNIGGILTPNTPNYTTTFQQAVKCKDDFLSPYYGACSAMGDSYTEALLTEARNAIDNTDPGECNAGFIRNEAMLHLIMVSDEPEQSVDMTGETWQQLADQIIAKRGSAGMVRISSIVGDVPNGCQSGGWFGADADPGEGYVDATNYTNGVFLSICDSWSDPANLQLLAETSVLLDAYPLDYGAVEETINVQVNGYPVSDAYWHYDANTQSVMFDSNAPQEGSSVTISYVPVGMCE
jgi:hypothetical protein